MSDLENYFQQTGAHSFIGYTQSMIVLTDEQGGLLDWNPAFDRLKAVLPSARSMKEFLSDGSAEVFQIMLDAREIRQTHLQLHDSFEKGDCSCLLTPLPDGRCLFFIEIAHTTRDEELSRLRLELQKTWRTLKFKQIELESILVQSDEISHTDPLTFLSNRKEILAELGLEILRSDRHHKPLTILYVDIDGFKQINDTCGHNAGDKVLQAIGCELLACVRKIDRLGRFGGDEFLFILPATSKKTAQVVAKRVLTKLHALDLRFSADKPIRVTASIGLAQYRVARESAEEFIQRAQQALLIAKQNGGDGCAVSASRTAPKTAAALNE